MKVAIVYNRQSKRVINLFGMPNQEKIGMKTIGNIEAGLKKGGHTVRAIEGDKELVHNLEHFMPRVVKGELPGLVFNVSYGIQGQARYTHVPGILEMVGIPYVGSGPLAHSLALDKVVAKMIFQQHGVPTPDFAVLNAADSPIPEITYPAIVKPKNEAVSFGLRIVNNEDELREGAAVIFQKFNQPVLVEQYIDGREINVGLLGNNPPQALPPVELVFGKGGPPIYTYDDKRQKSGRTIDWECPANLPPEIHDRAVDTAIRAFNALGCYDCARVDMRLDADGNLYVLEINSLPSMGEHGSYTIGARTAGLDFDQLVCRLVEVASARYFGTPTPPSVTGVKGDVGKRVFSGLIERRDEIEKRVEAWTRIHSRSTDPVGVQEAVRLLAKACDELGLSRVEEFTNDTSVWTWQSKAGLENGSLLIGHLDVPLDLHAPSHGFRRDPEWLYGEGIASSRAPLVCALSALRALRSIRRLRSIPLGLMYYSDEGRAARYSGKVIEQAAKKAGEILVLRPGNPDSALITQRRGWRRYRLTVNGEVRRLGKAYKRHGALQCAATCLDEFASLTNKEKRLAVATGELKTESHPQMLPHRVTATALVSFLSTSHAEAVDRAMRKVIKERDCQCTLELVSDRPPFKLSTRGSSLYKRLLRIAEQWEIPLSRESSLAPSVAGLTPRTKPVLCGLGPVARDVDTPHESVLRISLMQRTLLLAQYLAAQTASKK